MQDCKQNAEGHFATFLKVLAALQSLISALPLPEFCYQHQIFHLALLPLQMSFRKRSVALGTTRTAESPTSDAVKTQLPGVRPSPIDGRSVTSTGAASLDGLLVDHGGLALGCSLLLEENGTTDYAGALLKFYAAEGLLQGHHVHVLGMPDQWGRELPGVAGETARKERSNETGDKMKIAWRYESLGQHGHTPVSRGGHKPLYLSHHNANVIHVTTTNPS